MTQRRALLLYATMTKNTEKVANWFKETFEYYGWDINTIRITARTDWDSLQDKCYFDDYDVVLLGSPIVGGGPLKTVVKVLSAGGDGGLEKEVQTGLDQGKGDNAPPPIGKMPGPMWRRKRGASPGMSSRTNNRPLGVVFTTYGGGFYGSTECMATLETLKLYLTLNDVDVIGKFSCAGRETGPAGYPLGVKPKADFRPGQDPSTLPDADVCDAEMYTLGDGTQVPGSYFFHYDCHSKPGPREEAKARAFIADIVEDYFMTYDGQRNRALSEILSIS